MRAVLLSLALCAAAQAAEPGAKGQGQVLLPRLELELPRGWQYKLNPGGPLTWTPPGGDEVGALQASRINDKDVGSVARQKELGLYAAQIGARLGWGKASEYTEGPCEMGRAGLATFPGDEEFKSMRLWVVVSQHSAYMWTWIGRDAKSVHADAALQLVMDAKEAHLAVPPAIAKAIDAAEKASPARAEVNKGRSVDQVHLAMLVDEHGKAMGVERPVLSGRLWLAQLPKGAPPRPNTLALEARFDPDVSQLFQVQLSFGPTVKLSIARDAKVAPSQPARLWAAQLWSLVGERIDAPYAKTELEAQVLGAKLLKTRLPSAFASPGKGEWLLLKSSKPGEVYVAINLDAGIIELFPVVPMQANDAARALFKTL